MLLNDVKEWVLPLSQNEEAYLRITRLENAIWRIQVQNDREVLKLPDYTDIEKMSLTRFSVSHEGQRVSIQDDRFAMQVDVETADYPSLRILFLLHDYHTDVVFIREMLIRPYEAGMQCIIHTDTNWSVLGLGEKSGSLNKKGRVWEMWNTDEPRQFADTDPLYASIPLFFHHKPGTCVGYLINSTARVTFDCAAAQKDKIIVSIPESHVDYCICVGDSLRDAHKRLTALGGRMELPSLWSLGFHQSRYSYYSAMQVRHVVKEFRTRGIPCDALHLDIHYMDYFRVFSWDELRFPDLAAFIQDMRAQGIHLITIVDPGVKVDENYPVYREGSAQNLFIRREDGSLYVGEVWPGPAAYPDFFNEKTQNFWIDWHKELLGKGISGIWNDMNEPANFRNIDDPSSHGPTVPGSTVTGYKQKDIPFNLVHNAYGTAMAETTVRAFAKYAPQKRPFVLTRAASFGAQRYAALWTGDNTSWWEHLRQMIPMLLNLGLSGFSFVGSDVGGFQQNANAELYTRWMAAACLMPFFRAHSELNSHNHEPWAFGKTCENCCRAFISLRYQLLPYIYTNFYATVQTGAPVMQSLGYAFENDEQARFIQDQYLIGSDLLVAPILSEGAFARSVYLPHGADWYLWDTSKYLQGGGHYLANGAWDDLPLYVRAGSIVPTEGVRLHTAEKRSENLLLTIYPDSNARARGMLYVDAGEGFEHREGYFLVLEIFYENGSCRICRRSGSGEFPWPGICARVMLPEQVDASVTCNEHYFQDHDEVVIEVTPRV